MRWQLKAAIQATLSRVPGGYRLHARLQRVAGTNRLDADVEYERKAEFLRRMLDHGVRVEGSSFLEVGTGWHPFLPLMLSSLGARAVVTVDLNPWLDSGTLAETAAALRSVAGRLAADFDADEGAVLGAIARLEQRAQAGEDPAEALRTVRIDYRYPLDAGATGLDGGSFDCVVSSNVLEHIPPAELRRIAAESRRLLRPGGLSAHHVDPEDHFSADRRISSVNFLKFSPRAWRLIASGLAYHNRLRCRDYPPLFERAGFEIAGVDVETDARALEALRSGAVRPHERFRSYSQEELAGALIDVFARAPA